MDKQTEEKMAKIKKDYRIAHDECLAEKHNKSEELRKDYEAKEDFAKTRPKKK